VFFWLLIVLLLALTMEPFFEAGGEGTMRSPGGFVHAAEEIFRGGAPGRAR
jgi:hypothetical protein